MDAAFDLFYRQGYEATVVNQIIKEAGISKPTFYEHFPSKEKLCVAYLKERRTNEIAKLKQAAREQETPLDRFMMPAKAIKQTMIELGYNGCPFYNMLNEVTNPNSPIAREVFLFLNGFRSLLEDVTQDLIESDPAKYAHVDPVKTVNAYVVLVNGAIMAGQETMEPWPFDTAIEMVSGLVPS